MATPSDPNVMPVYVGAGPGSSAGFPNQLFTSVTLCLPGTTTCQTIGQIQVDTGSTGLRLFRSVLNFQPTLVSDSSGTLAACAMFGGGNVLWGPLASVSLQMGNEPAVQVPIQLVDFSFATPPPKCSPTQSAPSSTPSEFGANGLLGISIRKEDCGLLCKAHPEAGHYFSCNGSTCQPTSPAVELVNPVQALPVDNNGLIVSLPAIPETGAPTANGLVIFGIGTRPNNQPVAVTALPAASKDGMYPTILAAVGGGSPGPSFFDSGSSIVSLAATPVLPVCSDNQPFPGFFCPTSTQTLTATVSGYQGTPSVQLNFKIANWDSLRQGPGASYLAFDDIGVALPPGLVKFSSLDLGLNVFYGRKIYFGIDGMTSPLGTGPYFGL